MTSVPDATIEAAIQVIGTDGIEEEEIEQRVRGLVDDDMTARRLIDWIPEAFGVVLTSHVPAKIRFTGCFSAKNRNGEWITLNLEVEPIFASAVQIAQRIYREESRDFFLRIALRGSIGNTLNNALNAGANLDGGCMSGPALLGIPAEIYPAPPKSFWRRIFYFAK